MTTIAANMVDEIVTKSSAGAADTSTIIVQAADSNRRPFVSFVRLDPAAGAMDVRIGSMVIAINGDLYSGLCVGNTGDAVDVRTTGAVGAKRYVITFGFLRVKGGNPNSGVQNA